MKKVGNLVAAVGKYTNRQGEEKTEWMRCGVLLKGDKGFSVKLTGIPTVPEWEGWFSVFEDRKKDDAPPPMDDYDDPLPF